MVRLRPYQEAAVSSLRQAYTAGASAPLLCAATGAGKTVMFSAVAHGAHGKGNRVLILAHRAELIRQASNKLRDAGVPHGIIAPGYPETSDLVQVGSVQTVARRLDRLQKFNLIVVDEAHHSIAGQYLAIIKAQPQAKLLGVTATPERLDGRGLGRQCGGVFDQLVMGPQVAELVAAGYLTPTRVWAPARGPDLSEVRTVAGDYDAKQLADAMDRPSVTGDAVLQYGKHAPGLPCIVFCVSVRHAQDVAEAFRAAGWRAVAAHGEMRTTERDAALGGLATGSVQVVCAADLISEGLDIPAVGAVILLRPTKSLGLHLQQIGRGLRPMPGKTHLVVLDHANNTATHGFAETPRQWSLEGRKRRQAAPAIRQCPSCYAVFSPQHRCPCCGHAFAAAAKPRQIEQRDGDLSELSPEDFMRLAPLKDVTRKAKTLADFGEHRFRLLYRDADGFPEQHDKIVDVVMVPTACLEDQIADHRATVLVCDIEGGEVDLLVGADLSGIRLIIMEIHTWAVSEAANGDMIRGLLAQGFNVDFHASGQGIAVLRR